MFRLLYIAVIRQYKSKQRKATFFVFLFCVFVLRKGCDEAAEKIVEGFWPFGRKKKLIRV